MTTPSPLAREIAEEASWRGNVIVHDQGELAALIDAKLETAFGKVPRTADGVPIVPDARVWCEIDGELCECQVLMIGNGLIQVEEPPDSGACLDVQPEHCHSTRAAALASLSPKVTT